MPFDVTGYTAAQRHRLEEIRRATEKERQLIALHAGSLARGPSTATDDDAGLMTADDDGELERRAAALERRAAAAGQRQAALLSRLALLQHREALVGRAEADVAAAEAEAANLSRAVEALAREVAEERRAADERLAEKRARLSAAKLSAKEEKKKREAVEMRSRLEIEEIQDRIREHRLELMRRSSALNDRERWLRQEQSRLRETEVAAIYRLRKEIELMEVSLYGDVERPQV